MSKTIKVTVELEITNASGMMLLHEQIGTMDEITAYRTIPHGNPMIELPDGRRFYTPIANIYSAMAKAMMEEK